MALDISVIVPCFNEAGNLRELVDRLEASCRVRSLDAEIILVNDGSRDNTGGVIRELEAGHPAVRGVLKWANLDMPLELHHMGDLPAMGGMGASSTV